MLPHFPMMHPPHKKYLHSLCCRNQRNSPGNRWQFPIVPLFPFLAPRRGTFTQSKRNTYIKTPPVDPIGASSAGSGLCRCPQPHTPRHTHTFNNPWGTPGKCTTHTQTCAYLLTTVAAVGPPSSLLSAATNRQRKKRNSPTPPILNQAGQDQPNPDAASFIPEPARPKRQKVAPNVLVPSSFFDQ